MRDSNLERAASLYMHFLASYSQLYPFSGLVESASERKGVAAYAET
jgi:hypothetical protein